MIGKLKKALVNRYHNTYGTKESLVQLRKELSTHRAARDAAAMKHYDALKAKKVFDDSKAVETSVANMNKSPSGVYLDDYLRAADTEGKLGRATQNSHAEWAGHAKQHTRVKDKFKQLKNDRKKAAETYASTRLKYGAIITAAPLAILGVAGINHQRNKKRAEMRSHNSEK